MMTVIKLRNGTILFPVHLTRPALGYRVLRDNVIRLPVRRPLGGG